MKKKGISGKPDNSYIENPHTIPFLLKRASVEIPMMDGPVSTQKKPRSLLRRGGSDAVGHILSSLKR